MSKRKLPPDPEKMNSQRAAWAATAIGVFMTETGTDHEDAMSDLLCDLMHFADGFNVDFAAEMTRARRNYADETALTGAESWAATEESPDPYQQSPEATAYRAAAKANNHDEGTLEIDDRATVSQPDGDGDGAYVQAWVWVSNEEAGLPTS